MSHNKYIFGGAHEYNSAVPHIIDEINNRFDPKQSLNRFKCCLDDMKTFDLKNKNKGQQEFLDSLIRIYDFNIKKIETSQVYRIFLDNKISTINNELKIKMGKTLTTEKEIVKHLDTYYFPLMTYYLNFSIDLLTELLQQVKKYKSPVFIVPSYRKYVKNVYKGENKDKLMSDDKLKIIFKDGLSCPENDAATNCYMFDFSQLLPRFQLLIIELIKHIKNENSKELQLILTRITEKIQEFNELKREAEKYNEQFTKGLASATTAFKYGTTTKTPITLSEVYEPIEKLESPKTSKKEPWHAPITNIFKSKSSEKIQTKPILKKTSSEIIMSSPTSSEKKGLTQSSQTVLQTSPKPPPIPSRDERDKSYCLGKYTFEPICLKKTCNTEKYKNDPKCAKYWLLQEDNDESQQPTVPTESVLSLASPSSSEKTKLIQTPLHLPPVKPVPQLTPLPETLQKFGELTDQDFSDALGPNAWNLSDTLRIEYISFLKNIWEKVKNVVLDEHAINNIQNIYLTANPVENFSNLSADEIKEYHAWIKSRATQLVNAKSIADLKKEIFHDPWTASRFIRIGCPNRKKYYDTAIFDTGSALLTSSIGSSKRIQKNEMHQTLYKFASSTQIFKRNTPSERCTKSDIFYISSQGQEKSNAIKVDANITVREAFKKLNPGNKFMTLYIEEPSQKIELIKTQTELGKEVQNFLEEFLKISKEPETSKKALPFFDKARQLLDELKAGKITDTDAENKARHLYVDVMDAMNEEVKESGMIGTFEEIEDQKKKILDKNIPLRQIMEGSLESVSGKAVAMPSLPQEVHPANIHETEKYETISPPSDEEDKKACLGKYTFDNNCIQKTCQKPEYKENPKCKDVVSTTKNMPITQVQETEKLSLSSPSSPAPTPQQSLFAAIQAKRKQEQEETTGEKQPVVQRVKVEPKKKLSPEQLKKLKEAQQKVGETLPHTIQTYTGMPEGHKCEIDLETEKDNCSKREGLECDPQKLVCVREPEEQDGGRIKYIKKYTLRF